MAIVQELKAFVFRRRQWRWLALALALALAGHFLDGVEILKPMRASTEAAKLSLERVQPFQIADYYGDAAAGREGIWFCRDAEHGQRAYQAVCLIGVVRIARVAIVMATSSPIVAVRVWHETGWYGRLLFVAMIVFVIALIRIFSRDASGKGEGGNGFLATILLVAAGPWIAGAAYWLLLHMLIVFVVAFGKVLGGATTMVATFGGVYKVALHGFRVVREADEFEEHAGLVAREIHEWKGDQPG